MDATRLSRDVNHRSNSEDTSTIIKAEIEEWTKKEEGQYQVSTVAADLDPWLHYTSWGAVLSTSKHSLVATAAFTTLATAAEPELEQVLQSWERIRYSNINTTSCLLYTSNPHSFLSMSLVLAMSTTTFHQFLELAPELRTKIWELAIAKHVQDMVAGFPCWLLGAMDRRRQAFAGGLAGREKSALVDSIRDPYNGLKMRVEEDDFEGLVCLFLPFAAKHGNRSLNFAYL